MLRLKPTPEYESARAALSSTARVTLRIAEDGTREDPHHNVRRHFREDGVTIDYSAEGLLVSYRVQSSAVELVDVIDLKEAPSWP